MTDPFDSPSAVTAVTAVTADTAGGGYADSAAYDLNHDGVIDTIAVTDMHTGATYVGVDVDGDGRMDGVLIDSDGDGYVDHAYARQGGPLDSGSYESSGSRGTSDPNPTHQPDPTRADPTHTQPAQHDPTQHDPAPQDPAQQVDPGVVDPFATETSELPETGDPGIHGDPRADIEYHTVQPGPVDCLPTSVSMVLSEVTGQHVPAEDVVALAHEKGFMTDSGMSAENSLQLLQAYGVDAQLETGTIDSLRQALDSGEKVIIGLDSDDLYNGGGGPFDPGLVSGHAVELTGIDDGPPAMIYINDPGFPDGAGVQVPVDLFEDAWKDADHVMVVAQPKTETVDIGAAPDAAALVEKIRLLPITLMTSTMDTAAGQQ